MTQTTGWRLKAIHESHSTRRARQALITQLKRERVGDSEFTPAELLARHRQLKADYIAHEARRRTTA